MGAAKAPAVAGASAAARAAGLLAEVLVAKFLDHLPLYRQEHILERACMAISHKAYIWSLCTTSFNSTNAVVFNFAEVGGQECVGNVQNPSQL